MGQWKRTDTRIQQAGGSITWSTAEEDEEEEETEEGKGFLFFWVCVCVCVAVCVVSSFFLGVKEFVCLSMAAFCFCVFKKGGAISGGIDNL